MAKACVKYAPARMDKRVVLEQVTRASDGQGGWTENWTVVATLWASIDPTSGYEKFQGGQTQTPVTHKITLRYDRRINTAKRLRWDGRVFDIKEVINEQEANAFLNLLCVAGGVAEGDELALFESGGEYLFQDGGNFIFQ